MKVNEKWTDGNYKVKIVAITPDDDVLYEYLDNVYNELTQLAHRSEFVKVFHKVRQ